MKGLGHSNDRSDDGLSPVLIQFDVIGHRHVFRHSASTTVQYGRPCLALFVIVYEDQDHSPSIAILVLFLVASCA
jgi:hypothetical protein